MSIFQRIDTRAALHVYLRGNPARDNEERALLFMCSHALLAGTSPKAVEKLKIN